MSKGKKYLSTGDIAAYCEVNVTTVKRWIREGHLPGFQTPMGHFRVTKKDFIKFLEDNKMPIDESLTRGNEKRVLIIDDDPGMIKTILMTLENMDIEMKVDSATDGYEGLMKIGQSVPDLLIIDLNMPKINGYEVIRQVKESEAFSSAEIIVVSSVLNEGSESILEDLGVSTYLKKPFKLAELKDEVTKIFGLNGSRG